MIVLSGADLVVSGSVQTSGTLVIDGDRIVEVTASSRHNGRAAAGHEYVDVRGHIILPGFIDVHVHGLHGIDALDGPDAVRSIAQWLPRYGVTAFCPTTVACSAHALRDVLESVGALCIGVPPASARVLPAHLESNFINPEYRGAQPIACVRVPSDGADVLAEIDRAGNAVGIITVAPEIDGGLDLIRRLVSSGRRVSLGHSGATLEQSRAAIEAGARHATHLFNRMPPLGHREPGLVGAVLTSDQVAAEVICDGVHVHPDMVRLAVTAKGPRRVMAITDGVAAAGLPDGAIASLGGRCIRVSRSAAFLEDGTLAGSVTTMDRVFRFLVTDVGMSLVDAVQVCATTAASELGLKDLGAIAEGAAADLVVMDHSYRVKRTYVAGKLVYETAE
jgi:N-acetylglucosamine-6-phosphate deacetylase